MRSSILFQSRQRQQAVVFPMGTLIPFGITDIKHDTGKHNDTGKQQERETQ